MSDPSRMGRGCRGPRPRLRHRSDHPAGRANSPSGTCPRVMMIWQAGRLNQMGRRPPPIPRSNGRAFTRCLRGTGSVLARRPADRRGDPARGRVHRRHLYRRPRTGLLRSGCGRRPHLGPRFRLHQRRPEAARSHRRSARRRAVAGVAGRTAARRRGLVRLPRLDRHRSAPGAMMDRWTKAGTTGTT